MALTGGGAAAALGPAVQLMLNRSPVAAEEGVVRLQLEEGQGLAWTFDLASGAATSADPEATLRLTGSDAERVLSGQAPIEPIFEGDLEVLDRFLARCVEPLPAYAGRLWRPGA